MAEKDAPERVPKKSRKNSHMSNRTGMEGTVWVALKETSNPWQGETPNPWQGLKGRPMARVERENPARSRAGSAVAETLQNACRKRHGKKELRSIEQSCE